MQFSLEHGVLSFGLEVAVQQAEYEKPFWGALARRRLRPEAAKSRGWRR